MIEVKHLVKKYGSNAAVNDLSFRVERGQIYGFLGPNGAGKSTTMNIITGYLASTEGTVVINGHDILEEPEEAKRCIGYLPEQPPLYFDMTVREYLEFAARLKKLPKGQRGTQISEVMEMTMITDMQNRLIKNLSKGYRQRVGLAQAVLGYPEVIILDEPTVGLDPKQIIEIRDLIRSLAKKHTVILSSHILSEVSAVCDYVMIIAHGQLVASDTPENLAKLMEGQSTLQVNIKGGEPEVRQVLESISKITEMEFADGAEEGTVDVQIRTEEDADIREELFYALAEVGCPILGMQISRVSLEDIFLELTAEESAKEQNGDDHEPPEGGDYVNGEGSVEDAAQSNPAEIAQEGETDGAQDNVSGRDEDNVTERAPEKAETRAASMENRSIWIGEGILRRTEPTLEDVVLAGMQEIVAERGGNVS